MIFPHSLSEVSDPVENVVCYLQRELLDILRGHPVHLNKEQSQRVLQLRVKIRDLNPDAALYEGWGGPMPRPGADSGRRKSDEPMVLPPLAQLETKLLREVYENARELLRYAVSDPHHAMRAQVKLEEAIARVRQFDNGTHEEVLAMDTKVRHD